MSDGSCFGPKVDCYNPALVFLGPKALVSQGSVLCTASHDYSSSSFPLIGAPTRIEGEAWIASEVFVGPGVVVGASAVALARAVVIRDVPEFAVVAGNTAEKVKERVLNS